MKSLERELKDLLNEVSHDFFRGDVLTRVTTPVVVPVGKEKLGKFKQFYFTT
jgi:hypothetical protein